MARCTAPVRGHHSAAAEAACPACRYRSSRYSSYGSNYSSYGSSYSSPNASSGAGSSSSSKRSKPSWSKPSSSLYYTPTQIQSLTPIRETVEVRAEARPDLRDTFLCHAWDDRKGAAKELHDLLEAAGVKVWFSEKDLGLGVPMSYRPNIDPLCNRIIFLYLIRDGKTAHPKTTPHLWSAS